MALSMATTVNQVAALVREITNFAEVYSAAATDSNAIPMALSAFPCAIVTPGADTGNGYILGQGRHRHTYEIRVQIFEAGSDVGMRAASVLPFVDLILEKFTGNVTLGGRSNSSIVARQGGLVGLEYAGATYTGYEITLTVSEEAAATAAPGS